MTHFVRAAGNRLRAIPTALDLDAGQRADLEDAIGRALMDVGRRLIRLERGRARQAVRY